MNILKSNITLILLTLVVLAVALHTYYTENPILAINLETVTGQLAETPGLVEQGEGTQYYFIEVKLDRMEQVFYLRECAFQAAEREQLLQLPAGKWVELGVGKKALAEQAKPSIYSFSVLGGDELLDLEAFNACHVNYWRRVVPFLAALIALLVYRSVTRIWTK